MQTIDISFAIDQIPHILKGVPFTLLIALVSMAVSLLIGSVFAFIRLFRIPVLRQLVTLYVSFLEEHLSLFSCLLSFMAFHLF